MCLGIPARVVDTDAGHPDLVRALVQGAERHVNVGLLEQPVAPGDWVMVHMGFAIEPMTPAQVTEALAVLAVDDEQLGAMLAVRPDDGRLDGTG